MLVAVSKIYVYLGLQLFYAKLMDISRKKCILKIIHIWRPNM